MRLAFCLDGYRDQVGVELRQNEQGVRAVVHGPGELDTIKRQIARVLSLDHNARGFAEVGQRDPAWPRFTRGMQWSPPAASWSTGPSDQAAV